MTVINPKTAGIQPLNKSRSNPETIKINEMERAVSGEICDEGRGLFLVRSIKRSVFRSCTWFNAAEPEANRRTPAKTTVVVMLSVLPVKR